MHNFKKNINSSKQNSFFWKRVLFGSIGFIAFFFLAVFLFIQFDTSTAANFSDEVLRPLLGNDNVIALQQVYFNTIDKMNQFLSLFQTEKSPFLENSITFQVALKENTGTLDLQKVSTNAKIPLATEGQWKNVPLDLFPKQVVMMDTFIRPDPARSYAFVTLIQMDMSQLYLRSVAGTVEPASEVGKPGPGVIPKDVQDQGNLIAAFDGGFQYKDGKYGMIVDGITYLPLQNDLATLVGYKNGRIEIIKYEGQDLGNDVVFVRQNCPMLIENGIVAANNSADRKLWGRTTTWQIRTWRSGIGITAKGNLIFALGNSLEPDSLASALKAAGAVNAMQLDINPNWVRFNIFSNFKNGQYSSMPIINGIKDGSHDFLYGDKKDFFYITKKSN